MKLWVIAIVLFIDQFTKHLALKYLASRATGIPIIPGFIDLKYSGNPGAALSMFSDKTEFLTLLTILAIVMIGWMAWDTPRENGWLRWGYSLILGGAGGNLIDRIFRADGFLDGHVVDFVQFPWFINNIADDAICVGVVCVIASFLQHRQERRLQLEATPSSEPQE